MKQLLSWITRLFEPKEPTYGDVRVVKEYGESFYEVQSYTERCSGDGDEWIEWMTVYKFHYYKNAVETAEKLNKVYSKKQPIKETLLYIRVDE